MPRTGPKPEGAVAIGVYRLADIGKLVPYARNARTHTPAQIAKLQRSIEQFGFAAPVITAGRSILAGHGRVLAAQQLGMQQVPTVDLGQLTKAQQRGYLLADNRLAELAGWDDDILKSEMQWLAGEGFDLTLTGWDIGDIAGILGELPKGNTDPDDAPDAPADPVTRLGDVWLLGPHRLVCGDCTQASVVDDAMGDGRPELMVTDPPYGVSYDASWRSKALGDGGKRAEGVVANDDRADWRAAYRLFGGAVAYIWHLDKRVDVVMDGLREAGFAVRAQIVWAKNQLVFGRGDYHQQHEPCLYAVRDGKTGHWQGDRTQTTLWTIDTPRKSETGHSTQKPVECMRRPIENNSAAGEHVFDPFVGSGTTIIACEQAGRVCHAIELMAAYVDVAVTRWQAFAGATAVLEADGRSFAQVGTDRAGNRNGGAEVAPPQGGAGTRPAREETSGASL